MESKRTSGEAFGRVTRGNGTRAEKNRDSPDHLRVTMQSSMVYCNRAVDFLGTPLLVLLTASGARFLDPNSGEWQPRVYDSFQATIEQSFTLPLSLSHTAQARQQRTSQRHNKEKENSRHSNRCKN